MTSCSVFQSLNIGMHTSMVSLSYPKTRVREIKSNPGKAHHHNIGHKSVIIRRSFLLSTYQHILN
jgi:hypothetical protein